MDIFSATDTYLRYVLLFACVELFSFQRVLASQGILSR